MKVIKVKRSSSLVETEVECLKKEWRETSKVAYEPMRKKRSEFENFLESKYYDFKESDYEDNIDNWTSKDLVYFFKEIAHSNGFKYSVNIVKDNANMSRLIKDETYTKNEIVLMIRFLYESNQNYLSKARLSVGVLCSSWVNTIYADAIDWNKNGEYIPESKTSKAVSKKEWKPSDNDDVEIKL